MKRQGSRKRRSVRRTKKQRRNRIATRRRFLRRQQRGGADLPVPEGAVVGVNLDPKDAYSVPVFVSKNLYENEVLED